ncbi:MAG: VOC family protein [Acidimicrobiaceae bacterium]
MTNVRRLNHAVLYVSDASASAKFYCDVLGFSLVQVALGGRAVFLRAGASKNHHDLGLFSVGPGRQQSGIGLYHLAWQVDTIDELGAIRTSLIDAKAFRGESDHGVSKSIYALDPDGIEFEVMWMVPEAEWGKYAVDAVVAPLNLGAEIARWSGVSTRVSSD